MRVQLVREVGTVKFVCYNGDSTVLGSLYCGSTLSSVLDTHHPGLPEGWRIRRPVVGHVGTMSRSVDEDGDLRTALIGQHAQRMPRINRT